jgi:DNA-binding NarL/FixJ family response regulator
MALIRTPYDDPAYGEREGNVLDLCRLVAEAMPAATTAWDEPRDTRAPLARTSRSDLGLRIAELAAKGKGVRQIARQIGVAPSTVSRRLRRT